MAGRPLADLSLLGVVILRYAVRFRVYRINYTVIDAT